SGWLGAAATRTRTPSPWPLGAVFVIGCSDTDEPVGSADGGTTTSTLPSGSAIVAPAAPTVPSVAVPCAMPAAVTTGTSDDVVATCSATVAWTPAGTTRYVYAVF